MMRQALGVKHSNRQNEGNGEAKAQAKNAGKMVRQFGTTNLRGNRENQHDDSPMMKTRFEVKENFEVYEDPLPSDVPSNQDKSNNMLYILDKKLEKKNQLKLVPQNVMDKRFYETREKMDDYLSICDENSTAAPSVCETYCEGKEEYENEPNELPSTTSTIRSEFRHFSVFENKEKTDPFEDADVMNKYTSKVVEQKRKSKAVLGCDDYAQDIYKYMCNRQTRHRSSYRYMAKQPDLSAEMRMILIDWFHDVTVEYGLSRETLHLATCLVDRVLSKFVVEKHRVQLVGTTALMIASKYEEIYPPNLKDFAFITDDTFTQSQILLMERYLLAQLEFVIATPTVLWFASYFAERLDSSVYSKHAMEYLVDLTLLDYNFLMYRPSHIAAACVVFSNVITGVEDAWPQIISNETGMTVTSFSVILPELHRVFSEASSNSCASIFKKYSENKFSSVALLPPPADKRVYCTNSN